MNVMVAVPAFSGCECVENFADNLLRMFTVC